MSAKHTPEPWVAHEHHPLHEGPCIDNSEGEFVATTATDAEKVGVADAKRIVACVNACEGIEDPAVVPEMLKFLKWLISSEFVVPEVPTLRNWKDVAKARSAEAALLIARAEGRKDGVQ